MKRVHVPLVVAIAVASFVIAGCAQATPAPTLVPTAGPAKAAEPTKPAAAGPTKAAAPQPTAAPTKKVDFPQKGKAITVIAPWEAGSAFDGIVRLLGDNLQRELDTPVQQVNRPGAGLQIGFTELATSRPDGYTMGYTILPNIATQYFDPDRKAVFTRQSYQPVALHVQAPNILAVKGDGPYKTMKDLIDAAKANPEKIAATTTGILSDDHIALLALERLTGARFAAVHMNGQPPQLASLLAGDTQVAVDNVGDYRDQIKTGDVRVLGIMDRQESKYYPGVKTLEAQGYPVFSSAARGISMPQGTPKEIADIMSAAIKKVMDTPAYRDRADQVGMPLRYMTADEFAKYWSDVEPEMKILVDQAKAQLKK